MNEPKLDGQGPFLWRSEAMHLLEWIKTLRPVAGFGIFVSEKPGVGTQISAQTNAPSGGSSGGGTPLQEYRFHNGSIQSFTNLVKTLPVDIEEP